MPYPDRSFNDEIDKVRFPLENIKLDQDARDEIHKLKKEFNQLAHKILDLTEVNRSQMLSLTALQEARMWAVQAVIDEQVP